MTIFSTLVGVYLSELWVTTTFPRPTAQVGDQGTAQVERNAQEDPNTFSNSTLQRLANRLEDLTAQVTAQVVWHCRVPRVAKEIMDCLGLKHWKTFRTNYLQPLLDAGWLEMTIPDKPTSSKLPSGTSKLEPAADATVIFRNSTFEDDLAKTSLVTILEQQGLGNVRSLW